MRFFRIHIIVTACLLSLFTAKAQQFRIMELPNQEQLPVANVHRIMQDSEGFMWYATEGGGICRDDGYRIEVFRSDKNHPSLLESNNITCMTEDTEGRIWFGTAKGAYILDKKDYSIHPIEKKGIRGIYIACILATKDSFVWIAAADSIFRIKMTVDTKKDTRWTIQANGYLSNWKGKARSIGNFYEDENGNLLAIQSGGGILRFNPHTGRFNEMRWEDPSVSPSYLTAGKEKDELWLATWGKGIVKYHPSATGSQPYVLPQPATLGKDGYGSFRSQILNIRYDRRNNLLWAASMDDLYAYRTNKDELQPYPTESFLPSGKKILDHLFIDKKGNLWVPGYSPHTFIVHAAESQIRRDSVKAMSDITGYRVMVDRIVREDEHYYWIWQGRTNLSLYDARHQTMVFSDRTAHPAPLSTAKCIEKRYHAPGIWTCNGRQLFKVWNEDSEIFQEAVDAVKTKENIRTLSDNRKGSLYIGTEDAIYRYDYTSGSFRQMIPSTGNVLALTESADGTVYFISESKGLCQINLRSGATPEIRTIRTNEASPNGFCTLATDPDGTLWCGTSHGNVCHYLPTERKLIDDEAAGNKNGDAIKNILVDTKGHVWILSDKYLKEYNPENNASRLLHSSSPHIDMDYFHTIRMEEDSVCLGGIGAFCMIAPSADLPEKENAPAITLWITEGNKHFPGIEKRHITLKHNTGNIEFFVSTFDYLHTDSIQFAYRLKKTDRWTMLPKGNNKITPEHISYGTSELEVKATNRYGIWQEPVVCMTIERELHWAITAGGYLLLVIIATGGVFLYTRTHKRKKITACAPMVRPVAEDNGQEEQSAAVQSSKIDEEFLRKAIETIEKNIDNADYSVEQFSSDLCMSRMNMYRKLQALTSQKPSEFIRDIRLKKAKELMRTTDLSVSEIVDRVGFGTSRYFSKCFKDKYGISPSQYRSHDNATHPSSDTTGEQM